MSEPYGYRMAERDALDALVDAEVELVLRRRPRPVVEPEVDEVLFLDQATAFLRGHADPVRLVGELQQRIAPAPAGAPPQPKPQRQTETEPAVAPDAPVETPASAMPPQAEAPR